MSDKEKEDDFTLGTDDTNTELSFGDESGQASAAQSGIGDAEQSEEEAAAAEDVEGSAEEEIAAMPVAVSKKKTRRGKAPSNVYTVLTFVAFVALTAAVVVMWIENLRLSEGDRPSTTNVVLAPFHVIKK